MLQDLLGGAGEGDVGSALDDLADEDDTVGDLGCVGNVGGPANLVATVGRRSHNGGCLCELLVPEFEQGRSRRKRRGREGVRLTAEARRAMEAMVVFILEKLLDFFVR